MGVINTITLLKDYGEQPIKICEKLRKYFIDIEAKDIYEYLSSFGMYQYNVFSRRDNLDLFMKNNYWLNVKIEYEKLRKKWNGPDVPIFILPVDERKIEVMEGNKGISGVAFPDKLFLFFALNVEEARIKALLTHEYNHVCRLRYLSKSEEEITLLDTIILEGLAEHAVELECGQESVAYWTKLYTETELKRLWVEIVYPIRNKRRSEKEYHEVLYGLKRYPKMLGYCLGFFLVKTCLKENDISLEKLEKMRVDQIIKLLPFKV